MVEKGFRDNGGIEEDEAAGVPVPFLQRRNAALGYFPALAAVVFRQASVGLVVVVLNP